MTADVLPVVSARSAAFGYAGHAVVSDLTFEMASGEVLALLGPNGSGKSTLVRGLLGLNEHLAGELEVLGAPVTRRSDRSRLGYVPQRHTLSGSVRSTVREVVSTGRLPHRPWWRPPNRRDAELVNAALSTVDLADRARTDVATLSGGQQRRVLIARALVSEPTLLIMDEPTAGVDHASQEGLLQVLRRLVDTGVTMLVVTHELAALQGIVDHIVEMDAGQVTFDGTPAGYASHVESVAHQTHRGGGDHHDEVDSRRHHLMRGPYDTGSTTSTQVR
ncbi:MAG: metal ABC transporter ATP-binding protein [Ornithinimicrobium sp.]|uniref:metal ABC transporter ATP-binding protein n=1 Tax=Ornithinimicrobium sp. TaxID=1977084 RepID=UPI003D9BBB58